MHHDGQVLTTIAELGHSSADLRVGLPASSHRSVSDTLHARPVTPDIKDRGADTDAFTTPPTVLVAVCGNKYFSMCLTKQPIQLELYRTVFILCGGLGDLPPNGDQYQRDPQKVRSKCE